MNKHQFEYYLVRLITFIATVLPLRLAHFIGDLIGDLFYFIIRTRKKTALKNLQQAFNGEKSERELRQILRRHYHHFGRMMIEFARIPIFNPDDLLKQVSKQDIEYIQGLINQSKGLMIFTGHFGNWEYLAAALAKINPPLYAVFKQQKNLAIDDLIKKNRTRLGLLPLKIKGGAAKGVINAIKQKKMVIFLLDQDAGKKGIFIDFFGRPASTVKGPAQIAIKYRVPIIMAFGIRDKNGLIKLHFHKFPDINQFSNDEQGVQEFLVEYSNILEKYIRQYPEQWFWMHRRWRTKLLS
jgi:KDO2-lipid IV(A) lauroyltransferase